MCQKLFTFFVLILFARVSMAQAPIFEESLPDVQSVDSLKEVVGMIPESLDANVDSLLRSWHVQYFSKVDAHCHDDVENVFFHDSIYAERLNRLPNVIQLPYNDIVRDYYMPRHYSTKSAHISDHYEKLLPIMLKNNIAKKVYIGNSVSYLVDAKMCNEMVKEILSKDIHALDDFKNVDHLYVGK